MIKELEEYKLLVDIYYKEVNLFYSKTTIFITIQLGVLAGIIAGYNMLVASPGLFSIGILFMIFLSITQILISIRGNTVNEALIKTLADFEKKHGFSLLNDFSNNTKKIKGISKMNFPSYIMVFLCVLFFFAWIILLLIVLHPYISAILLANKSGQLTGAVNAIILCIYSGLYAVTMKISDLLDEHGLRLFKGAPYIFSILCAIFGCLLIAADDIIANIIFAMIMGFVVRKRIDYNNHILAFIIITSYFLFHTKFNANIYFPFLATIIILGFIKDTKYKNHKSKLVKFVNKVYLFVPIIYALPSLVFSLITSNWVVFFVFFTYDLFYNITRLVGERGVITKVNATL